MQSQEIENLLHVLYLFYFILYCPFPASYYALISSRASKAGIVWHRVGSRYKRSDRLQNTPPNDL
jgi:hypothetical protein